MSLIFKFFNQFLKHKTSIIILICSILVSQFFIYFISAVDPTRNDPNGFLNFPIGMIFLPSLVAIFIIGSLFYKYANGFAYLRKYLHYNNNFYLNLKITVVKIFYFYVLAMIFFLLNWTIAYGAYFSVLGAKGYFSFLGVSMIFLLFMSNLVVFLHNINFKIKTNIVIFVVLFLFFFSFYNLNAIYNTYEDPKKQVKWPAWLFFHHNLTAFYYVLLNFNTEKLSSELNYFLGDQHQIFINFLLIYGILGLALLSTNLLSSNSLTSTSNIIKNIFSRTKK